MNDWAVDLIGSMAHMLVAKQWLYDSADRVRHIQYCYPSSYIIVKIYLNEGRQTASLYFFVRFYQRGLDNQLMSI
jgi:hypothetical protein